MTVILLRLGYSCGLPTAPVIRARGRHKNLADHSEASPLQYISSGPSNTGVIRESTAKTRLKSGTIVGLFVLCYVDRDVCEREEMNRKLNQQHDTVSLRRHGPYHKRFCHGDELLPSTNMQRPAHPFTELRSSSIRQGWQLSS